MGWFHYAVADGKLDELQAEAALTPPPAAPSAPVACTFPADADPQELSVPSGEPIYHLCQKKRFYQATQKKQAYFPPTFLSDGRFTRASIDKAALLNAANLYYKDTSMDVEFLCLELDAPRLMQLGIPVTAQVAPESTANKTVQCLQIFGGISTTDNVVLNIYEMKRDASNGTFLEIVDIDCGCHADETSQPEAPLPTNQNESHKEKTPKKGLLGRWTGKSSKK